MGGIGIDVLPGDAELARRAAGGDGAAFVRLYDHYSADVFEGCLGATGSVERAADATQAAFLKLLRRPPAIDAPDSEVAERLRVMALGASAETVPLSRRTAEGGHAPAGAGAGWLRSETVAKASARFDADWSGYLAAEAPRDRTATEIAHAWERATAEPPLAVERVASERPVAASAPEPAAAPADPPRRRRLRALVVMPRIPLPSTGALAAFVTVAVFGAAVGVALTGGGGAPSGPAATAGPGLETPAAPKAHDKDRSGQKRQARRGRRRGSRRSVGGLAVAASAPAGQNDFELAGYRSSGSGGYGGGDSAAPLGAGGGSGGADHGSGTTRQVSSPAPDSGSPNATREPAAMNVSPPSDPPPPGPSPSPPPPSEPAPAPAEGDSGGSPNCHSSKASNPC
jgi:hypothetical protein